jgi:predicted DNA-binding transcriptional regulator YafY
MQLVSIIKKIDTLEQIFFKMPKHKEALIRYRVINRCIKDNIPATKSRLKEACEKALSDDSVVKRSIGIRTIDSDIHAMRYDSSLAYYAPIEFDRYRRAYYYDDPDYSIDNLHLNSEELQSLTFAATLLDQFKHVEMFNKFTGSVQKIVGLVNINRFLEENGTLDFVQFEKVPFVKGSEYLGPIIEAIRQKQVLSVTYRAFYRNEDHDHIIHPYLLKEYRNRWYLIGYHNELKENRTYGLDRIVKIAVNPGMNYIESRLPSNQYFKDVIGIFTAKGDPPEIKFELAKETAKYIINQPIHESQKTIKDKKLSVIFSLTVHPTVELVQLFLSWGPDIKIISPKSLKEKIIEILNNSLKNYKKS